ncbi:MAG: hypothetical protein ACR2P2_00305 [Nakamurella sp.]
MSARRVRPPRRWVLAALPALAAGMLAAGLTIPAWAATGGAAAGAASAAAPALAAAAPATTVSNGQRKVSVSPAGEIPGAASSIGVKGSGFSGKGDLWVAICQDGKGAPNNLNACLGGSIPGKNVTKEWATVTDNPDLEASGLNVIKWQGGSFSGTLQLTSAADASADCVTGKCSVYVRSSESGGKQNVTVPIAFQGAAGSSSSSSATTSTSTTTSATSSSTASSSTATSGTATSSTATSSTATSSTATSTTATSTTASSTPPVPTTVQPQSVLLDKVQQGRDEVVVFDGFTPGEAVSASISGNPPVKLTVPRASSSGSVRVAWKVPATFPVAGYSLRVEGAKSLRVGVASFSVIAAPVVSSASSTASAAQSTASSVASSIASAVVPATASSSTPSSTAVSAASSANAAPTTIASVVAPSPADTSSKTPLWLWITLASVVLIALVVGAVALGRRHRQETEAEQAAVEADLAAAAGEEAARQQQATMIANQPPRQPINPGAPGEYDEHPDRPILFSHRQAEQYSPPTDPIDGPDTPTQAIGGTPRSEGQPPPPQESTQSWRPDFSQDQSTPSQPAPSQPTPSQPAPSQPAPSQPTPGQPAPDRPQQEDPGSGTQLFDALADDDTAGTPDDDSAGGNASNGNDGNGNNGSGRHRGEWSPPSE